MRSRALTGILCVGLLAGGLAVRADEKSDAVVKRAREALTRAKTLQADVVLTGERGGQSQKYTGTVRLLKPNLGEVRVSGPDGQLVRVFTSTGKELYITLAPEKQYVKEEVDPKGQWAGGFANLPAVAFFDPGALSTQGSSSYLGKQTVDGAAYEVVRFNQQGRPPQKVFFNNAGVPVGVEMGEKGDGVSVWLRNVKLDAPLTARQFAYTPPAGFKPYERPSLESGLLPVGREAPSFQLPTPSGQQLSLENTLKGKKAVLINFWFHG